MENRSVQKTFADKLSLRGFHRIECPAIHASFELPFKAVRKRKRIPINKSLNNDIDYSTAVNY